MSLTRLRWRLSALPLSFEGHTENVFGLALSSNGTLLASAVEDDTIKLWAFESRQLLACSNVPNVLLLIFSSDSRQLVYATSTKDDSKIYVCKTPPDILSQARVRIPRTHLLFVC
jgi:WD40 repeat protein